ncbi:DUF983 domain-containing protein [Novosphingobium sp. PY1]|uniref:DUF983 domain-containing protein n=1 Tax=Novosphingobium sp. PY1 TaxID=1882221 RepID=UPI000BE77B85|nr:DUF983 domain-containing protein [Novosphingobium sp. PY1]BBA74163.1 hypothetical protein [Novosphingobium sp. PY1]GFM31400.1 uncharacterized protein PY1_contig-17-97 [Novosphingobium sp. PY1]
METDSTDNNAANRREAVRQDKARWIFRCGMKGLCPRCGDPSMFHKWLKLNDHCPNCGLDYSFAAPDDGPAFFSLCIVAFPLTFFAVWLQVAYSPPFWVHLLTSFPLLAIGCVWPLQYIKGWLVASQFVNKAQEAGTETLWAQLNARAARAREDGDD